MSNLLAWYNLIFYIPLVLGMICMLGLLFGMTDTGHGVDVHADLDGDASADADGDGHHDGEGTSTGFLTLLGVGKAPLLIIVMTLLLSFGGVGTISNFCMQKLLTVSGAFSLISVATASIVSVVITGFTARAASRIMPTMETASTKPTDLVGKRGHLILGADAQYGLAHVKYKGDLHQVQCRAGERMEKGTPIVVIDYDAGQRVYIVGRDPSTD